MGWYWVFSLVVCLLVPGTMVLFGWMFRRGTPDKINGLIGYRSARSMKNEDTWAFAHQYCGRLWWRMGLALLPLTVVGLLLVFGRDGDKVGAVCGLVSGVQMVPMLGSVWLTERALKRTFDKDGNRKNKPEE
ncbi:SdpI family protein [Acutalibacter caecimuris]|uniref:SdpI family protein n=1 Tax=Acutalibacter caecimuris TaxID=3093657 RepID=UPI002AC92EA9|nr:SdpI family protein [Acutalibacter sp. M00118]